MAKWRRIDNSSTFKTFVLLPGKLVEYMRPYLGEFKSKMAENGRIILPSKFLDDEDTELILWSKTGEIIEVWNVNNWEKHYASLLNKPARNEERMRQKRSLFRKAVTVTVDLDESRITIPKDFGTLRTAKEAVSLTLVGMYDHFEIWKTEAWEVYAKQFD